MNLALLTGRKFKQANLSRRQTPEGFKTVRSQSQKGFTLLEVLLVLGLFGILMGLSTVNIIQPQVNAYLDSDVDKLSAEIRQQQLRSITADTNLTSSSQSYGVYFEASRYILFTGTNYSASDTKNIVVNLETNDQFSTINLTGAQIVFQKLSGEVNDYSSTLNNVVIRNSISNQQKVLNFNRYGVLNVN